MSCSWIISFLVIRSIIIIAIEEKIALIISFVVMYQCRDAGDDEDEDDHSSDSLTGCGLCKDDDCLTEWLKWSKKCLCLFFEFLLIDHVW